MSKPDYRLNLGGIACPNNYLRAKLKLEDMEKGETLEIIIDDGQPIRDVPRATKRDGFKILNIERAGEKWKVLIEK